MISPFLLMAHMRRQRRRAVGVAAWALGAAASLIVWAVFR